MFNPGKAPREGDSGGDRIVATVADVSASGVSLLLPEATAPTQIYYQKLASANVAVGDLVLCLRVAGTIIVLDKIV
jgi:hypothetical protein